MPAQVTKSPFLAKVGGKIKEAHKAHANDEVVYSNGGDLPGGITGGVAEVRMCRIQQVAEGKQNAGEWLYFARAVVQKPREFKGQVIEGMGTSIIEPLYDTPDKTGKNARKTFADHYAFVLNELRKMGINTAEITHEQIEGVCKSIEESKPLIKFSTTEGSSSRTEQRNGKWVIITRDSRGKESVVPGKSYPSEAAAKAANKYLGSDPMVFHNWNGLYGGTVETNGEMVDESAGAGDDETIEEEETTTEEEETTEETETVEEGAEGDDIDSLVERANEGDDEAKEALKERGEAAGLTLEEMEATETYEDLKNLILSSEAGETQSEGEEEETAEEEVEEEFEPEVGSVYGYKPPKSKSVINVKVLAISKKNKTAKVQGVKDKKVAFPAVPWDKFVDGV